MHRILLREVVIDAPASSFGPARDFWAAALDAEPRVVEEHPEFTGLRDPAALPWVGLQRLGSGPARLHLDLESDDPEAEVARLVGLGATVVERGRAWVVLRDPAGLLFCVLPPESPEFDRRARRVGTPSVPVVRDATADDLDPLATSFADWPKPRRLFVDYLDQQRRRLLDLLVVEHGGAIAGYGLVRWEPGYPPFRAAGIPGICDLAVLAAHRRHGSASSLLDEAERRAGARTDRVGIGVGLFSDYGPAQRLYVGRGYLPDGAGLVIDGTPVPQGSVITLDNEPELMLTKRLR